MILYIGRVHTIMIAKGSSWLDVEIGNKHNQLVLHAEQNMHGEEQELKQGPRSRLQVMYPSLFEKEA